MCSHKNNLGIEKNIYEVGGQTYQFIFQMVLYFVEQK